MASRNAFALLAEDADPSASPAPAPKPPAPAAPAAPASRGSQKTRGGPASRAGKYYARGGARGPASGAAADGADNDAPQERAKFDNREGRGRGRGRGGPRGRGRQYDRHSQTGKTDSDKKVHQAWGGDEPASELKAEETGEADASAEAAPEADGEATPATPGGDKAEGRPRREPEEEDNTLTLEQYLAQKKEKEAAAVPKLEGVRQANEGADDNIWEGAVPLEKQEEDAYFVGKNKSSAPKSRGEKKEKVFIEIDARFERPSRGGRGRGGFESRGRGEGRGEGRGRGRGGARGRGGRANGADAPSFSVDDETAFPSLS